ncbi:hypothetical protein TraAM80_04355 [Trypanosoma rangeli]|uniref:Transmembrane protein n=1 Tax=Trypanosoma rangeli TaxID=5698 RepID=A0A3R7NPH3_TRYRA|nr:uncharacterized protein TraAM80_04355 [Trypanosoma rangeli]RNF05720.1 hypothetical protein TraAM80_04355 [Trypanosoma rangeli]|eukprot:RNF05720.1 hypothetical protein TraAM80_04355 [Trypanosoma rangeli]
MPRSGDGDQQQEEEQRGKQQGGDSPLRSLTRDITPGSFAASRSAVDAELMWPPREEDDTSVSRPDVAQTGEWPQPCSIGASVRSLPFREAAGGTSFLDSEALMRRKWGTLQKECPLHPRSSTPSVGSVSWSHAREASIGTLTQLGTPPPLRASAAVFVFTLNEEESLRQSPPLEVIASSGKREGNYGVSTVPHNIAVSASSNKGPIDAQKGVQIGAVATQKAESVDLQRSSFSLGAPQHSGFLQGAGERTTAMHGGQGLSGISNSCRVSSERRTLSGGDDIVSSSRDVDHQITPLSSKNNEDLGSAKHVVCYKVRRFQKNPNNDDRHGDGMSSSDDDCCCCRVCNLFWCCRGDCGFGTAFLAEDQSGRQREKVNIEQHPGSKSRFCGKVFCQWVYVNAFAGDHAVASQILCLMNCISGILVILAVLLLLAGLWNDRPIILVNDGSICHGTVVPGVVTPDISFSILLFLFNASLAAYCAIRAVRYENTGLLICHFIAVLLQLCRVMYFLYFMNIDTLSNPLMLYTEILLGLSAFLLLASCGTYRWVRMSFGWGRFMRGITRSVLLQRHRRQMFVQSFVQLDVYGSINSALTVAYMVGTNLEQFLGLAVAVLSCAAAMLYPVMLRRRSIWFVCFFSLTLAFSLVFYCYVISSAMELYLVRNATAHFEASRCYKPQLLHCLRDLEYDFISQEGATRKSVNGSRSFLPSEGDRSEFFQDSPCKGNCLLMRNDHYVKGFTHCCEVYGNCRLRDGVQSYGVVTLTVLAVIVWTVRIILVWVWASCMAEDAEEAARGFQNPTFNFPTSSSLLLASSFAKRLESA